MLPFILKIVYVYLVGFMLAVLEIQIEGKNGWAANLPTWRPNKESKTAYVFQRFFNKDLTGYHLALMPLLLLFFHLPYVWGVPWTWPAELETLAFFILISVFWDFLWFVLNPNYSLADFGPAQIWWHKDWWGRLPAGYYKGVFLTILLYLPLIILDPINLVRLFLLLFITLLLILFTILVYPKAY